MRSHGREGGRVKDQQRLRCPLCAQSTTVLIDRIERQPPLLNQLLSSLDEALQYPTVTLEFVGCSSCGFVWNASFDPSANDYEAGYVNDQSRSPTFREHLNSVRSELLQHLQHQDGEILEIASGQGDFLSSICRAANRKGLGYDPAYVGTHPTPDVTIHPVTFDEVALQHLLKTERRVGLLICRHVLSSLPYPFEMLDFFHQLLKQSGGLLYLEIPDFEWIAKHASFFDFYHESHSLFTTVTLSRALALAGFSSKTTWLSFHGQYISLVATSDDSNIATHITPFSQSFDFAALGTRMQQQRSYWRQRIATLRRNGPVVVWGAGGKGVSLVAQLHLGTAQIANFVDINPAKWGRFVPIYGQRVIAPKELIGLASDRNSRASVVLLNPNYVIEIQDLINSLGIRAHIEVVDSAVTPHTACTEHAIA